MAVEDESKHLTTKPGRRLRAKKNTDPAIVARLNGYYKPAFIPPMAAAPPKPTTTLYLKRWQSHDRLRRYRTPAD
ncbi:MAG: hypothetical protein IPP22_16535 [Nitrosomonas sp.]|nr:hypothetical protein [Nitrosomonas sp.]